MTKKEKIQEAYGEYWESVKDFVDENGWHNRKESNINLLGKLRHEIRDCLNDISRPESLKGIEKNHGWIKIESEDDLPTIGQYYTIASFNNSIVEREFPHPKFSLEFNKEWWLKYITHYQPIVKPQPPIY